MLGMLMLEELRNKQIVNRQLVIDKCTYDEAKEMAALLRKRSQVIAESDELRQLIRKRHRPLASMKTGVQIPAETENASRPAKMVRYAWYPFEAGKVLLEWSSPPADDEEDEDFYG